MSSGWYQSPRFCRPSPRSPAPCPCGQVSPRAAAGREAPGPRCPLPTPCLLCRWSLLKKLLSSLKVGGFWVWKRFFGAVGVGRPHPRGGSRWILGGGWLWERAVIISDCVKTRGRGEAQTGPLPAPLGRMAGQVARAGVQAGEIPFRGNGVWGIISSQ